MLDCYSRHTAAAAGGCPRPPRARAPAAGCGPRWRSCCSCGGARLGSWWWWCGGRTGRRTTRCWPRGGRGSLSRRRCSGRGGELGTGRGEDDLSSHPRPVSTLPSPAARPSQLVSSLQCSADPQVTLPAPGDGDGDGDRCVPGKQLQRGAVLETLCLERSCSRLGAPCAPHPGARLRAQVTV